MTLEKSQIIMGAKSAKGLASINGLYFLISKNKIIYIGSSCSVMKRLYAHSRAKEIKSNNYLHFDKFFVLSSDSTGSALKELEGKFIDLLRPRWNRRREGKLYPPNNKDAA